MALFVEDVVMAKLSLLRDKHTMPFMRLQWVHRSTEPCRTGESPSTVYVRFVRDVRRSCGLPVPNVAKISGGSANLL